MSGVRRRGERCSGGAGRTRAGRRVVGGPSLAPAPLDAAELVPQVPADADAQAGVIAAWADAVHAAERGLELAGAVAASAGAEWPDGAGQRVTERDGGQGEAGEASKSG